jgi:hypothetical protein
MIGACAVERPFQETPLAVMKQVDGTARSLAALMMTKGNGAIPRLRS